MNTSRFFHSLCALVLLFSQTYAQTCSGGGAPSVVTLSLAGKASVDEFDDNNNNRGTLTVGFPGEVVALQATGVAFNTVGLSYCEEAVIEIADVRNSTSNYVDIYPSVDANTSPCTDLPFSGYFDLVSLGFQFPTNGTSIYWELWETFDDNLNLSDANYTAGTVTIYVCPAGQQLPLDLKSFTGAVERSYNILEWTTASEQYVQAHILERSPDGTTNWQEIGRLPSKGQGQAECRYELRDQSPLPDTYYRLRTLEMDGRERYSGIVLLERKQEGFGINAVYPAPFIGSTTVQWNAELEQPVYIQVFDPAGHVMMRQQADGIRGLNNADLDFSGLPAGIYLIDIDNGSKRTAPVRVTKL